MINLTPYTFQPFTCRIVRLWKNARLVSDWMTLTVGNFCCSCCEMLFAGSTSTSSSYKCTNREFQLPSSPTIDAGKSTGEPLRSQRVVIDFSPRPEDTVEVQERCVEFLKRIDATSLVNGTHNTRVVHVIPEEDSISPSKSKEKPVSGENVMEFPAIHAVTQLQAKGAVKAAFEAGIKS